MSLLRFVAFSVLLSLFCSICQAARPLGFERHALYGVDSAAFADISADELFASYTKVFSLVSYGSTDHGRRLIDIEVHSDQEARRADQLRFSGVWVENVGTFKLDSWLQLGASAADLDEMATLLGDQFIPLDIERYEDERGTKYAVIWQRNRNESKWRWKLDVTYEILTGEEQEGFRIVDFDHFIAESEDDLFHRFDAITVENSGDEFVQSKLIIQYPSAISFDGTAPASANWLTIDPSYQIVDIENVNWDPYQNGGNTVPVATGIQSDPLCFAVVVEVGFGQGSLRADTSTDFLLDVLTRDHVIDVEGGPIDATWGQYDSNFFNNLWTCLYKRASHTSIPRRRDH